MRGAGREVGRGRSRKNRQSESEGGVSGRGGGEGGEREEEGAWGSTLVPVAVSVKPARAPTRCTRRDCDACWDHRMAHVNGGVCERYTP